MTDESESTPKFCSDCGLSLQKLDTWCTSRPCEKCGKEVYFVRPGEDGGIKIEAGEKIHIPKLTFSLDPSSSGVWSQHGLEGFLKQIFIGERILAADNIEQAYKNLESEIDSELSKIDCINHCDLEDPKSVEEAARILESHDLLQWRFKLAQSVFLRGAQVGISSGNAEEAAWCAHQAALFKNLSILEDEHLKRIIWLGYSCYVDLSKNEKLTEQKAKEERLVAQATSKIQGLDSSYLYSLLNDGDALAPRLMLSGLSEKSLNAIVQFELDERKAGREEELKDKELEIGRQANKLHALRLWLTAAGLVIAILSYTMWKS